MKKSTFISIIFGILLSACATTSTPNPDAPVSSDDPSAPSDSNFIPSPADSALTRGNVTLSNVELLTMESFPLQFMLSLKGDLPTPCHQLRIAVSAPNAKNEIGVDVYSVVDPNEICAQVLEPFEVNYPLGSYPTGHYILIVNGIQEAEFDA